MPVASISLVKRRCPQNVLGVHPSGSQKDAGRSVLGRDGKETESSINLRLAEPFEFVFNYFNICIQRSDILAPLIQFH